MDVSYWLNGTTRENIAKMKDYTTEKMYTEVEQNSYGRSLVPYSFSGNFSSSIHEPIQNNYKFRLGDVQSRP